MKRNLLSATLLALVLCGSAAGQSIFSGEPVQVVGAFNGYSTTPYNSDYRTTVYRRLSITSGNPTDGRGQWHTTINIQTAGGDAAPINMPGGSGNGFLFISGPSSNRFLNKWVFSGIGQATVNGINNISAFNSGNDMGLNMSTPGYYSFVFNDCGYTQTNGRYYVAYTTAAPVTVTRSSEIINPDGSATINITAGAAPSAQENIFVRYTTGVDFSGTGTSSIVQASGSGTSYSATIPAQSGGTVVRYYVFTSTRSLAQLTANSEAERSIAALRYDDNAGSNFAYTTTLLPVTIVSFTAQAGNGAVQLRWQTADEINIDRYELQRSADGRSFAPVYTVAAKNAPGVTAYEWNDVQVAGTSYYRVAVLEKDGSRSFSQTIRVGGIKVQQLSVYPNPVADRLSINLPALARGRYQVNVINMAGQLLSNQPYQYNGSDSKLTILLPAACNRGRYMLVLKAEDGSSFTGEFLVQ